MTLFAEEARARSTATTDAVGHARRAIAQEVCGVDREIRALRALGHLRVSSTQKLPTTPENAGPTTTWTRERLAAACGDALALEGAVIRK